MFQKKGSYFHPLKSTRLVETLHLWKIRGIDKVTLTNLKIQHKITAHGSIDSFSQVIDSSSTHQTYLFLFTQNHF